MILGGGARGSHLDWISLWIHGAMDSLGLPLASKHGRCKGCRCIAGAGALQQTRTYTLRMPYIVRVLRTSRTSMVAHCIDCIICHARQSYRQRRGDKNSNLSMQRSLHHRVLTSAHLDSLLLAWTYLVSLAWNHSELIAMDSLQTQTGSLQNQKWIQRNGTKVLPWRTLSLEMFLGYLGGPGTP